MNEEMFAPIYPFISVEVKQNVKMIINWNNKSKIMNLKIRINSRI